MFSTSKWMSTSSTQIIKDIDDVMDAILDPSTGSIELLALEERSSFMNEYSSLSDTRLGLSKRTTKSKLVEVLDQCEALKLRIQMACRRHRADEIRRGGQASPETSSTRRQSIESSLINMAPSSGGSISDNFSSVTTYGNSLHTAPMSQQNTSTTSDNSYNTAQTGAGASVVPFDTPTTQQTTSWTSTNSPSASTISDSYHTAQTGAGAPEVPFSTPMATTQQTQQTTSRTSTISTDNPSAPLLNEKDCMVFDANSTSGSPTFNVDSDGATGSTFTSGSGGPPRMIPQAQQQQAARVYPSQTARVVKRDNVMYFGPGSTTDSPTYNKRSQNASGAMVSCGA